MPDEVLYDRRLTGDDVRVYAVFARHAAWKAGTRKQRFGQPLEVEPGDTWIGQRTAGELLGRSEDQVYRSIKRLKTADHLASRRRGYGKTSLYTVTALVSRAQSAEHGLHAPRPERGTSSAPRPRDEFRAQAAGRNETRRTRSDEQDSSSHCSPPSIARESVQAPASGGRSGDEDGTIQGFMGELDELDRARLRSSCDGALLRRLSERINELRQPGPDGLPWGTVREIAEHATANPPPTLRSLGALALHRLTDGLPLESPGHDARVRRQREAVRAGLQLAIDRLSTAHAHESDEEYEIFVVIDRLHGQFGDELLEAMAWNSYAAARAKQRIPAIPGNRP